MEVFELNKDTVLNLRVRKDQLKKIKELGFKYIDCWEFGFERICENERPELEKLDKKYHDLYIHVHTKLENFGKKLDSEYKELDRLLDWYNKRGTSIDNPTEQDIQTVKYQIRKRNIESFNVDQIFDYWRSKPKDCKELKK